METTTNLNEEEAKEYFKVIDNFDNAVDDIVKERIKDIIIEKKSNLRFIWFITGFLIGCITVYIIAKAMGC